ncbi:ATP-binding protein [Candidatus Dojkabacteria bacterium]|uniref:ATP-binding protein n=1 Tax=Candidatus Dojkabacteria bacterium TaxID=2099670 RepID=A0A955KY21_9BACT|nr:ATP-binding protein [Candidatus Dojkabacteria bacterium]
MEPNNFTFNISLSVLNHLGRNLYRSFVTVLGEAISNSWDADAENVWIYIDKNTNSFVIKDDGMGMTSDDFQNKFLKIGYSKRKEGENESSRNRPYIGRKGIGKLALLSCAKKISILSKTKDSEYVGGVIDNSGLDQAITDDLTPDEYKLGVFNEDIFSAYTENHEHGTIIYFEDFNDGVRNTLDYLKKMIALYFRFSLLDNTFNIFLNDEKITQDNLDELASKTEFLWEINTQEDPYKEKLTKIKNSTNLTLEGVNYKGFIASVEKPRDLKVINTDERVSVDLFVNGRLREKDILKHMPSARIAESYLYGQIHYDELDSDDIDRFTSSREGIVADDPKYKEFLEHLKSNVLVKVIEYWDKWRLENREDGDPENEDIPKKERKSRELYNAVSRDYTPEEDSDNKDQIDSWVNELGDDAQYNFTSYAECFISENLLRKHIESNSLTPTACCNTDQEGKTCEDRYDPKNGNISLCVFCKGARGKQSLESQKIEAGTSIQVRSDEDNILMYLDYIDLAKIINDTILKDEDKSYKPLRNSVMHTSRLTDQAKTKLTSIFDNVIATVKKYIGIKSRT